LLFASYCSSSSFTPVKGAEANGFEVTNDSNEYESSLSALDISGKLSIISLPVQKMGLASEQLTYSRFTDSTKNIPQPLDAFAYRFSMLFEPMGGFFGFFSIHIESGMINAGVESWSRRWHRKMVRDEPSPFLYTKIQQTGFASSI
jgi:hypothetical protein